MQIAKKLYNPFVRTHDSTIQVMTDVILALVPCIIMACLAYGSKPLVVILVAVGSAVLTEFLFSFLFLKQKQTISDGSAIVTAILLSFTVGTFTPLYLVAFGSCMAVLFGKLLWGGLGKNRFNPALAGREFMTVFFPVIMGSGVIWHDQSVLQMREVTVFGNQFLDSLIYRPSGAIGEYSVLFLVLGGLFLLFRRRISWHIPFGMTAAFALLLLMFSGYNLSFSLGGIFLGAIYMATDMPTSTSTPTGKLYYGIMIGILCVVFLLGEVVHGYFSYSILLMNGFVQPLNKVFMPKVWGKPRSLWPDFLKAALLTVAIFLLALAIIYLHHHEAIIYLVYLFMAYSIFHFIRLRQKEKRLVDTAS